MGTRMRSDTHKVLHPIAGKPMLMHLLDTVDGLGAKERVVVVGKGRDQVEVALNGRGVKVAHQAEQKGTAHAVQQAESVLSGFGGNILILYGDTPFVAAETLTEMLARLEETFNAQRRFVADASHELRTPLTALRANADIMLRQIESGIHDRDDLIEGLTDTRDEVDRMTRLVQHLLTLARADVGWRPELQVVDLTEVARDAARARAIIEEFERPARAGPPRRCPNCQEDNPAWFEVCWKCGTSIAPE